MQNREFSPGFRCSALDAIVLAAGILASLALGRQGGWVPRDRVEEDQPWIARVVAGVVAGTVVDCLWSAVITPPKT